MDLSELREEYQTAGLDIDAIDADPIAAFEEWFVEVQKAGLWEPNAMVVATVDAAGMPHARNVLLKAVDERGFVFYTNYESDKGRQLLAHPQVALTFSWIELRRQVRINGLAEQLPADESDAYFASRPRGSQLGAWASPQSRTIAHRGELDDRWAELDANFGDDDIERPAWWGGFRVRPSRIEFWQGRPNRLHDRLRFERDGEAWSLHRLAP